MNPSIYVVVTGRLGHGDVAGVLVVDGKPLWSHLSSSVTYLKRDLTDGFGDRKEELERRFPDGYNVEVFDLPEGDKLPDDIAHLFEKVKR